MIRPTLLSDSRYHS